MPVGRPLLANPDLVARWRAGAELNEANRDTFYGGGAERYTDYPTIACPGVWRLVHLPIGR